MYEYIYILKPIKEIEPNWYKLKWEPIRHTGEIEGTWCFVTFKHPKKLSFSCYFDKADNGWGRSYKVFNIVLKLWFTEIMFWVRYDIHVHKDGPIDTTERKSIII